MNHSAANRPAPLGRKSPVLRWNKDPRLCRLKKHLKYDNKASVLTLFSNNRHFSRKSAANFAKIVPKPPPIV